MAEVRSEPIMSGGGAVMGGNGYAGAAAALRALRSADASQRRGALLGAALVVPSLLMLAGVWQAWALFVVPLALAFPLAGGRGLITAASVTALGMALVSGHPQADGLTLVLGYIGFMATGGGIAAVQATRGRPRREPSAADRLTGLLPAAQLPAALRREAQRARRYAQPLTLAVLEPDNLEELTARHGPRAADRLLGLVGQSVCSSARGSDLAARGGGARLVLIVPGPMAEAAAAVDRIRAGVAARVVAPLSIGGGVTVSAGLASYAPAGDADGLAMLARAEAALLEARAEGGDRVGVADAPSLARLLTA
jgi:diguanylate cyclase (GGDEF)-like protein